MRFAVRIPRDIPREIRIGVRVCGAIGRVHVHFVHPRMKEAALATVSVYLTKVIFVAAIISRKVN